MKLHVFLLLASSAATAARCSLAVAAFSTSQVGGGCYRPTKRAATVAASPSTTKTAPPSPGIIPGGAHCNRRYRSCIFAKQRKDPFGEEDGDDGGAFFKPWSPGEPEVEVSDSDKRLFLLFIMTPFLLQVVVFAGVVAKEQLGL